MAASRSTNCRSPEPGRRALLAAFLLSACGAACNRGQEDEALRRDLGVYEAVLRDTDLRGQSGIRERVEYLAVFSESDVDEADWLHAVASDPGQAPAWLAQALPSLRPDCLQDFARANLEPGPLPELVADVPVRLMDPARLDEFWEPGRDGSTLRFWELHSKSTGMLSLSRIGYDAAAQQALVYCACMQGGLTGAGYLVLLKRFRGHVWQVQARHLLWEA